MTDKTLPPDEDDVKSAEPLSPAADPAQEDGEATIKGPEQKPGEIGGPKGPEPTRYGDWEFKGRCSDF
ncbi:DUF1674 domain-containing protein [Azospirillum sp. sgz302134]